MKANRGQMEKALDGAGQAGGGDVRFFLLYGPDESGSAALARRLERAMGPGAERIELDGPTLRDDPARLADEAASISMFGDKRWIRVGAMGEESVPALTALLEATAAGNPVIAVAGALKPSSKLLKLALEDKRALALISYAPDAREAEQIAVNLAREGGLRLSTELARRIVDTTNGDRALMAGEIDKLVLYLDAALDRPRDATAEALDALSAENPESETGPLVNAVLGGDMKGLVRAIERMGAGGLTPALRPLLTRAMLIAQLRAEVDRGSRPDAAVEAAGKQVFWKEKGQVARQLRQWDSPGVARAIQRLLQAERVSRSDRATGDLMVRHELLAIARQAARDR